jgi:hypothetical protein
VNRLLQASKIKDLALQNPVKSGKIRNLGATRMRTKTTTEPRIFGLRAAVVRHDTVIAGGNRTRAFPAPKAAPLTAPNSSAIRPPQP